MIDVPRLLGKVTDHALTLGRFERVNLLEPANAPGSGLTVAVWVDTIGPAPRQSGLDQTTGLLTILVRIYARMLADQNLIDPNLLAATVELMAAYSADFQLGDEVRNVDTNGAMGPGLSARAGYIDQADTKLRVMTITLPLVINDIWAQSP